MGAYQDLTPGLTEGLHIGAVIGSRIAQNRLEQQRLDRLFQQTQFANQIQLRDQAIQEADAARKAQDFQQVQDFAQLVRQTTPGGGDFGGMTPAEQDQAQHTMRQRQLAQAPPSLLPRMLGQEESDYEKEQRLNAMVQAHANQLSAVNAEKDKLNQQNNDIKRELEKLRQAGSGQRNTARITSKEGIAANALTSRENLFGQGLQSHENIADQNRISREYVNAANLAGRASEGAATRASREGMAARALTSLEKRDEDKLQAQLTKDGKVRRKVTIDGVETTTLMDPEEVPFTPGSAPATFENLLEAKAAGAKTGALDSNGKWVEGRSPGVTGYFGKPQPIDDAIKKLGLDVKSADRAIARRRVGLAVEQQANPESTPSGDSAASGTTATAPAIDPLPSKESDLVKDKLYKTPNHGVKRWDGKYLVNP